MLSEKHYRPLVHFSPAFGWLNDPNGLVYKDGEFHLFYQYHPHDSVWGPMHWGHAVSQDLLAWRHLPIALSPDAQGQCFSGTATLDADDKSGLFGGQPGLLAYYTIAGAQLPGEPEFNQSQGLAYSRDNGRHWHKYAGNPVVKNPGLLDFRDPKVFWHAPSGHWIMLVTLGQKVGIYRSLDAINWTFSSEFGEGVGAHDERAWECPDLFELQVEGQTERRWVLIVGVQRQAYVSGSGTQYFIGHFDGERFINDNPAETVLWLDYGRDFYACQTWADVPASDGRRLALSWMSCWPYANFVPTQSWRSLMTLPQTLDLRATADGLRLHRGFVAELDELQQASEPLAQGRRQGPGPLFQARWPGAARLTLNLSLEEGTTVRLTPFAEAVFELSCQDGQLSLRSSRSGAIGVAEYDTHYPHDFSVALGANRPLSLDLLLDRCSSELLVDAGRYAISNLVFSAQGPTHQLSAELLAGAVTLHEGQWHTLAQPSE